MEVGQSDEVFNNCDYSQRQITRLNELQDQIVSPCTYKCGCQSYLSVGIQWQNEYIDATATARLIVWEKEIGPWEEEMQHINSVV